MLAVVPEDQEIPDNRQSKRGEEHENNPTYDAVVNELFGTKEQHNKQAGGQQNHGLSTNKHHDVIQQPVVCIGDQFSALDLIRFGGHLANGDADGC
ncbi:MAG: hypothetical protein P1V51_22140, partial [Deltaproteobacteria bacterium]|nr:hypothetical protein [Deltaproteobacteria bacterium]